MTTRVLRRVLFAGAAIALLAACSDSSIQSPGEGSLGSPPPPPPPPPSGSTVNLVPAGGCPTGTRQATQTSGSTTATICQLTGEVQANVEIPAGAVIAVSGPVFVGTDAGPASSGGATPAASATITFGAGAKFVGQSGSDFLVISRGSRIMAEGTSSAPVIFTSLADELATRAGTPRTGSENNSAEWGGVVINGRAPINACIDATATGGTVNCQKSGEGSSGLFGGASPADNSGVLRYVQVRYAGFRINNENELNGVAFQGVGSGTVVDYLQVHNGSDDGVEFFGGTVDAKHLVLTGNEDDSLDWTDGWIGRVQYAVVRHRQGTFSGTTTGLGDQGFEMDNRELNNDRLPRSNPIISNFTIVGANTSNRGLLYRAGTNGRLVNGIVTGFAGACLDIDDSATYANLSGDEFASLYLSCPIKFDADTDSGGAEETVFRGQSANNRTGDSTLNGLLPGAAELAVPATTLSDSFFTPANYVGAFGPTETTTSSWASGWTFGLFPNVTPTCPTGTTTIANGALQGRPSCRLPSNITSNLTLTSGLNYEMAGPVFVGADRGGDPAAPLPSGVAATLTIEAGAVLYGASGSDYLVITRGSQLRSLGTPSRPVIFTARSDLQGTVGAFDRNLWGGIVINGRAPINACIDAGAAGGTANCSKSGEGSSGLFGGNASGDDSGSIFYTQVKYAGFRINNENELNGIAFQGVGNATDVDYVQVHNNSDDGVEFFGGTVNAKHLVLTGNEDDSLDWTDGWTGKVQYVIVQQSNTGDQGFEMDNRELANDRLPRSNPIISNFTVIGGVTSNRGLLYRAGTQGQLVNGVVTGFNNACLDIDDASTQTNLLANAFRSLYFSCTTNFDGDADPSGGNALEQTTFQAQASNRTGASTLSGFTFIPGRPGVVPGANELAVPFTNPGDPFFDTVTYVGAVRDSSDAWFRGWTFQQQ